MTRRVRPAPRKALSPYDLQGAGAVPFFVVARFSLFLPFFGREIRLPSPTKIIDTRTEGWHKRKEVGYEKEVSNEAEDPAHQTGDIAGGFAAHRQLRGDLALGRGRSGRHRQL